VQAGASFDEASELIRGLFDSVTRHDVPAGLALCAPDVTLKSMMGQVEGGQYAGHDGLREWYRDVVETFDPFDLEVVEIEDAGGCAVVTGRASGRTSTSQMDIAWSFVALAEARDGLIRRCAIYADRDELRAAEGV
jgi:ketosteroid isomerase-like protein